MERKLQTKSGQWFIDFSPKSLTWVGGESKDQESKEGSCVGPSNPVLIPR